MEDERVYFRLFGRKLISFRQRDDGSFAGTGLLNPLLEKLSLLTMICVQAKFYRRYRNLATWHGKTVPNSFAPPVGSRPQLRAMKNLVKTHLFGQTTPCAMTFAVTYRCLRRRDRIRLAPISAASGVSQPTYSIMFLRTARLHRVISHRSRSEIYGRSR